MLDASHKLFKSVVPSTALYGLETSPLTKSLLHRIDVVQRAMLRRIIGWVCYNDDTWEDRGRRMAEKLRTCLLLHPMKTFFFFGETLNPNVGAEGPPPAYTLPTITGYTLTCLGLGPLHYPAPPTRLRRRQGI